MAFVWRGAVRGRVIGLGLESGSESEFGFEPHFSVDRGLPRLSKLVRFGAVESSMGFGFGFGLEFQSARVRLVWLAVGWLGCLLGSLQGSHSGWGLHVAFVWRGG